MSYKKNQRFVSFELHILSQLTQDIETFFHSIILPSPLKEACQYAMMGGGKRVRPLLVASSFVSVVYSRQAINSHATNSQITSVQTTDSIHITDDVRRVMLAVELLHAYSLIHDDLPCMDDDELRRGRPTTHIKFGEATALLAGDVLQSLAFEVLTAELNGFTAIEETLSANLLAIFAPRARRMVSGQMLDLEGENQCEHRLTQDELQAIHADKTGALIEASVLMGARCGYFLDFSTTEKQENNILQNNYAMPMKALEKFSQKLGLAFQVQDDILDVTADTEQLGKPSGSDEKLDKSTYVKLMGTEKATEYAKSLFCDGVSGLEQFGENNMLVQLADWLWLRKK